MHSDPHKSAEVFIEKVVARLRQQQRHDPETVRARAEAARENRDLARKELLAGGLDPKPLDALAEERSKLRRQLIEQAHRRAVEGSEAAAQRLRDMMPELPPPPADPVDTVIDQVTFIRSFADQGVVIDSNIESFNNWARYKLDASADAVTESGTGRLSFFTLWQNTKNKSVIVNAGCRLVVNAHLSVDADFNGVAAWFISDSDARATVRARTTVWGMDSSVSSIVQDRILGDAAAHGGFFGDDNDTSIEFNDMLPATGVVVRGNEFILIEVELLTDWTALDGSVHLDAQSGSFKVTLPQLVLTVTA